MIAAAAFGDYCNLHTGFVLFCANVPAHLTNRQLMRNIHLTLESSCFADTPTPAIIINTDGRGMQAM